MITRIAPLCALLAPAVVPGQITARVESLTELHVTAASSRQSVPPSTVLNGGSSLDVTFYDNRIFCRAATILDPVASDERGIRVRLVERGEALIMMGTGIAAAFLIVGTQRIRQPLESCFLYADPVVILPFSIAAPDRATIYVPPPPFPVAVTLQGFTLVPVGFHASNGLAMACQ